MPKLRIEHCKASLKIKLRLLPHQSIECRPKVQNTTKSKSVKNNNKM